MQSKKQSKLSLAVGAAILGLGLNAQAEVSISGHVSYNMVDRDSEENLAFQRNGFSESRFRFIANTDVDDLTVGIVQEFGIAEGEGAEDARRQEVLLTGDFGGLRLGQGNDAGDGILNGDLSGTAIIQPLASLSAAYGYSSSDYNGFDPGRGERIRYDSPKLAGAVVISGQIGEDNENELALAYKKKFDDGSSIRGGLFVSGSGEDEFGEDKDTDSSGFLIAYLHSSGFNIALTTAEKDNAAGDGEDGEFSAFKLGYKTGRHAVSISSGTSENAKNLGEVDATGIAYVFTMSKGVEFYAGSMEFDADDNSKDEDFVVLGSRVKF